MIDLRIKIKNMKITALNLDIQWKSPKGNINIIEEKLKD